MTAQPMFPLQSALLPGEPLPLRIFEPRYSQLVRDCLEMTDPEFGVVLITRGLEVGGGDVRGDVGALARITEYADHGMGQYQLGTVIGERIRVREWLDDVEAFWGDELSAFKAHAEKTRGGRRR